MSWPKEDSSVVTPRVRPTVPMAEAASNRGAHEGMPSTQHSSRPPGEKEGQVEHEQGAGVADDHLRQPPAKGAGSALPPEHPQHRQKEHGQGGGLKPARRGPREPPASISRMVTSRVGALSRVRSTVLNPVRPGETDWNRAASPAPGRSGPPHWGWANSYRP